MKSERRAHPGIFITLEGVDGSGKSTQAEALASAVRDAALDVVLTREPGGSPVAERVRRILLDPEAGEMAWATEVLLYLASRAEHVAKVIRPALEGGAVVICDRFLDSTLAYQAWGREGGNHDVEASAAAIRRANDLGTGGLSPEKTFLLDLDPGIGLQRALDAGRAPDRLEKGGIEFLSRVRTGFLELAAAEAERFTVVDADRQASVIQAEISSETLEFLRAKGLL